MWAAKAKKISHGGRKDMKRRELIREIIEMLRKADEQKLEIIYEFLRHLLR